MGKLTYLELKSKEAIKRFFAREGEGLSPERLADSVLGFAETALRDIPGSPRKLAPDIFGVWLSPADFAAGGSELLKELERRVKRHVEARGYLTAKAISVRLGGNPAIAAGQFRVVLKHSASRIALLLRLREKATGRGFEIGPGQRLSLGRDAGNSVVIDSPQVSSRHASVELGIDGRASLRDLESSNGTYFREQKVKSAALAHGDCFRLGKKTSVEFQVELVVATER